MFILLTIFAILISVSSVSAASTVYVNATGGNDSNTGTSDSPYQTIAQGISSVDENGTVYIANGVYNGTGNTNITLDHNMNIIGQSQVGTIINGTGTNWIFKIPSGVNVLIQNLTITNATKVNGVSGGVIYNSGNLTVDGCSFTGNINSQTCAGICNGQTGVLKVVNSNFRDNIAGYSCTILNFGVCTVENSTFINNRATMNGGAIGNVGTLNVTGSNFIGNHASYGGVIVTDQYNQFSMLTNSEFHFCSFIGNTATNGNFAYNGGLINATDNWWGSNTDPRTVPNFIYNYQGSSDVSSWIVMTMNADNADLKYTQSTLVTVSFNNRSNGTTVTSFDPNMGHIPDGTVVAFSNSMLGSFNPTTAKTINGIVTSLFTTNQTGTDNLKATTNNQIISTPITVVSAASTVYVNATGGNDSNDGTIDHPYKTIQKGIISIEENGTVQIADGVYSGMGNTNITILRSVRIIGQSQVGTIINGTGTNWIFKIPSGVNVLIQNLTITNATKVNGVSGGVIYNSGNLTVDGCSFTGNINSQTCAGICNGQTGVLKVVNSNFRDNIAGYSCTILNFGVCTVENSTFINNRATMNGGAIGNVGTLNVTGSNFIGNHASYGGVIVTDQYNQFSMLTNSEFHFCSFIGNTATNGNFAYNGGLINATDNWWGSNTDPRTVPNFIYNYQGSSDVSSWIVMTMNADNADLKYTQSTLVTVSFNNRSNGTTVTSFDPNMGHIPDGTVVAFSNSMLGSFNPTTAKTINGIVTSLFTTNQTGTDNLKATTNNQIISTPITVNKGITTVFVGGVSGFAGENVTFTANLADSNGNPVKDGQVTFKVNNTNIGTATVSNGVTSLQWTIPASWTVGNYSVVAEYSGSGNYLASISGTNLTVTPNPTTITVNPVSGYAGQNVTFTADLVDSNGNPVTDGTVTFTVGSTLNPVPVNNGLATINWTIPTTWAVGNYSVVAEYSGSSNYLVSTNGTNLTVTPNPTTITVGGVKGYVGQSVNFTANLVDSNGNPVTDGRVTFRVNNNSIGTVDVSNAVATLQWTIPTNWTVGNYSVVAEYSGSSNYLASTNSTLLTLKPSAYLYMNVTNSKSNPTVGDTFLLTYKLSNNGPDNATNVTVSFQIPAGLEFVNVTVDNGTVTYNPTNRTVTWTLTNVEVGDPYLYLTVKALGSGSYTITPAITSETFNQNNDPLTPFSVNVQPQNNNKNSSTTNSATVNAASNTVPMQTTGMPIAGLVLAILAVLGGTLAPRKK